MHDKVSSQQSHKVQDIVVCTCTVCGKVQTLKSFEVTDNLDGSRIQDSRLPQKSSGLPWFTQVYPLEGSFQWWEWPCSPCAETPETPETASAAWRSAAFSVGEDRMTMARGHSCRSRFEEFSAAIANWCSSMKFNPASYDIFYRCSILSSSTGSMDIWTPDRSSKFQWMLYSPVNSPRRIQNLAFSRGGLPGKVAPTCVYLLWISCVR